MKPDPQSLLPEITFKTARSGGKGGQHVNKVSSKVELNLDVKNSKLLAEEQKEVILEKLANRITSEGVLQIIVQSERSQLRNKRLALVKFEELINACFVIRKPRKETKVPKSVIEKRLKDKKRRAEVKKWRRE